MATKKTAKKTPAGERASALRTRSVATAGRYTSLFADGREVAGLQRAAPEGALAGWIACFVTPNLEAAQARARGARAFGDAYQVPGVGRVTLLADQEGTPFALCRPEP